MRGFMSTERAIVGKQKSKGFRILQRGTLESFTPWSTRTLQVLDLLLKGQQLVSEAVIHAKTVPKQSITHTKRRIAKTCGQMGLRQPTSRVHRMLQQCF